MIKSISTIYSLIFFTNLTFYSICGVNSVQAQRESHKNSAPCL